MEEYVIHDNREKALKVIIDNKIIKICKGKFENAVNKWIYDENKPIMTISSYEKLFVGIDKVENFEGNSLLVNIKDYKYIFIGHEVYEFTTPNDKIIKYFSPVGNNDVPYPFAIGMRNTYLMLENVYLPNKLLEGYEEDRIFYPYDAYYGFSLENKNKDKKKNPFRCAAAPIKKKILQKRIHCLFP
jgi:hypothetical protein